MTAPADAREVLPDLAQVAPWELGVAGDSSTGELRWHLGFNSAVDNVGDGPLIIRGHRASTDEVQMTADQWIKTTDGGEVQVPAIGKMQFVYTPTHNHWHYLKFDTYELRDAAKHKLVRPDAKTGFCLGDRYVTYDDHTLPAQPPAAVFTGGCGYDSPELLNVEEGISVGFGDNYGAQLEGQFLDITGVPAGRYNLIHRANADKALHESSYDNNVASLLVDVKWPGGTSQPPTVKLLDTCTGTDQCGSATTPNLPALTTAGAQSLARSAVKRVYGKSLKPAVSGCKSAGARGRKCSVAWSKGKHRYSGTALVSYGYGSGGKVIWSYLLAIARDGKKLPQKKGDVAVSTPSNGRAIPYLGKSSATVAYCPLIATRG